MSTKEPKWQLFDIIQHYSTIFDFQKDICFAYETNWLTWFNSIGIPNTQRKIIFKFNNLPKLTLPLPIFIFSSLSFFLYFFFPSFFLSFYLSLCLSFSLYVSFLAAWNVWIRLNIKNGWYLVKKPQFLSPFILKDFDPTLPPPQHAHCRH